jgi:quercetin dioxygenase-like cupin family protein/DNA-binding XRE family transcriptional regulator
VNEDQLRELALGARIGALRERRGMAREELARRAALTEEALAEHEDGRSTPSVGELVRLAGVLDVSVGYFFQHGVQRKRVEVVRSGERWLVDPPSEAAHRLNYRYQSLSFKLSDKLMSPFLVEIPPSAVAEAVSSQHEGEEFLFVLSGQLEVRIGGEVHRLSPGDAIYYDSELEHSLRALEGAAVRVLACVAQPLRIRPDDSLHRAFGRRK